MNLTEIKKQASEGTHHARLFMREDVLRLVAVAEAAMEVRDSIPASFDDNDPLVQRHAAALNALNDLLRAGVTR